MAEERDEQLEYGFTTAVFVLDHTARKLSPDDAEREFGETAKENFWRMWPVVREWADELHRQIEDERGHMATPVEDEEIDEVGGGG
jgi:hypothetical protein